MPTPFMVASLQLTLLLTCAAITAIVAVGWSRDAHGLAARLRRLTTGSRTAEDAARAEAPQPAGSPGLPPPPPTVPDPTPLWPSPSPAPSSRPPSPPPLARSPLVGARYGPETFALVAEHADHTQRLAIAEARVEQVLATLPSDGWFVQRFALVAGDRIPFLVLGEYGIFAIWPIGWRPQWSDPAFVSRIASNLKKRLPGYPGPVNAALCGILQPDIQPRYWYRTSTEGGAWMLGLDWLLPWMEHFGHQHGLGTDDIKRFRALAKPDWSRPVAQVPPGIPIINNPIPNTE